MVQLWHLYMTIGKSKLWLYRSLLAKWCLCFLMLSRFVIAFLPRSKSLLTSWLQSPSVVILEPKKIKPVNVFTFSLSLFHEVSSSLTQTLPMNFRKNNHFSLNTNWLWQTQDRSSQTLSSSLPSYFYFPFNSAHWRSFSLNPSNRIEEPHVFMALFALSYLNSLILTALGKKTFYKV